MTVYAKLRSNRWPLPLFYAFVLGLITVFGFAPFYAYMVPWFSIAALFWLWHHAATPVRGWWLGFAFGLGLYGFGIHWIYISLHTFGGMPWWFAGFCTLCLCAFMASFVAAVGWLAKRGQQLLWLAPVLWALSDWVRSWIFTGFPWLTLGYSQVPDSPLIGLLPVLGVYGVSLVTAYLSAGLVYCCLNIRSAWRTGLVIVGGLLLFAALAHYQWSQTSGQPLQVALLQGNISQDLKWSPEQVQHTLQRYLEMVRASHGQLIVLPETAMPILSSQMDPDYTQALQTHARQQQADILLGVIEATAQGYFNSAISLGVSPSQSYAKQHLVPFGEYIPLRSVFGWIYRDWLHMPMSDLSRGNTRSPMSLAGHRVGVNICYEDVFGEEIAKQLPLAELLVNLSNDAWYGRSIAADQHLQFSQARAIETGRMVLRSTNTGATAMIDTMGQIRAYAPQHRTTILTGEAQAYRGQTPYVFWQNQAFLCLCGGAVLGWWLRHRARVSPLRKTSD